MSESRRDDGIVVTRYCGPAEAAVQWYTEKSRVRFEVWRVTADDRERLADLNIREAAALAGLFLEFEPAWGE